MPINGESPVSRPLDTYADVLAEAAAYHDYLRFTNIPEGRRILDESEELLAMAQEAYRLGREQLELLEHAGLPQFVGGDERHLQHIKTIMDFAEEAVRHNFDTLHLREVNLAQVACILDFEAARIAGLGFSFRVVVDDADLSPGLRASFAQGEARRAHRILTNSFERECDAILRGLIEMAPLEFLEREGSEFSA